MRCLCEKIKRLKNSIYEICDYNVPYEITLKEAINKLEKSYREKINGKTNRKRRFLFRTTI